MDAMSVTSVEPLTYLTISYVGQEKGAHGSSTSPYLIGCWHVKARWNALLQSTIADSLYEIIPFLNTACKLTGFGVGYTRY